MTTLPFIEALRLRILHLVPLREKDYPAGVLDIHSSTDKSKTIPNFVKVRAEATIYYDYEVREARVHEELEQAVCALARQMYGPIETELREIRELMWARQLAGTDIDNRMGKLIKELRAEPK